MPVKNDPGKRNGFAGVCAGCDTKRGASSPLYLGMPRF
jgi:hypothetical protein